MVQQSVCDPNYGGALMYVLFGESLSNFVKHGANCSQSHWREPDIARGARLTEWPPLSVIIRKHSRHHQPQSICLSIIWIRILKPLSPIRACWKILSQLLNEKFTWRFGGVVSLACREVIMYLEIHSLPGLFSLSAVAYSGLSCKTGLDLGEITRSNKDHFYLFSRAFNSILTLHWDQWSMRMQKPLASC